MPHQYAWPNLPVEAAFATIIESGPPVYPDNVPQVCTWSTLFFCGHGLYFCDQSPWVAMVLCNERRQNCQGSQGKNDYDCWCRPIARRHTYLLLSTRTLTLSPTPGRERDIVQTLIPGCQMERTASTRRERIRKRYLVDSQFPRAVGTGALPRRHFLRSNRGAALRGTLRGLGCGCRARLCRCRQGANL